MTMPRAAFIRVCTVVIAAALAPSGSLHAQGIALTGIGPVNRAMGGAGTAAPLDAMAALHWNPGSISALPDNEIGFGIELLYADAKLSSSVGGASGTTRGDAGWTAIPAIGWVHHLKDSPMTIGLGVYGVAGFKNNLPVDPKNPLLASGPVFASAEILQIAPTLSYQFTEKLSVGVAPTITTVTLNLEPLGPSVITPAATTAQGNRMHWGAGFQAGAYYRGHNGMNAGLAFKSPQRVEEVGFFTPGGTVHFNLDYPMILSLGLSCTGWENWVFAVDARYLDYEHTAGFREFGWRSVYAGAIGAQYRVNQRLFARLGYNFNQDQIQPSSIARNLLDPLIQEQNVATGFTYRFAKNVDINLAYVYLVNNSVSGPLPTPPFPAGSTATHHLQAHSAVVGVSVRY
jgi:long-chain fatty acid transport protein